MPKIKVKKSIFIDSSPEKIFEFLNNLNNWKYWSPWIIAEPSATVLVNDNGKYHEWDGEIIGSGNLQITETKKNENIRMQLNFIKPWRLKALTQFSFELSDNGTIVSWEMESDLPFFLFWMKKQMEIFVGMDYERGLSMMKDCIEMGSPNSHLEFRGINTYTAKNYIGIKTHCDFQNIPTKMEEDFTELMVYIISKCKKIQTGNAFTIYHKFDPIKGKVSYTACHEVKVFPDVIPARFDTGKIQGLKAFTIRHKGPYRHIGNAWAVGSMHERKKRFKTLKSIPPMEIMYNSPKNTPENELISDILFPVK